MELVAQPGSPDFQLHASSARPPSLLQNTGLSSNALPRPAQQRAKSPQEGEGCLSATLVGSALRASNLVGFSDGVFSNPDSIPGSTRGFCRHAVADSTQHLDWRQTAQFNPEKMETEAFKKGLFIKAPSLL